jgi:hypothetical protein
MLMKMQGLEDEPPVDLPRTESSSLHVQYRYKLFIYLSLKYDKLVS